ncbi:unnamed protein product [Onchocerca ochengi]|uniref:CCDC34 domain-containing protein n=1 Tax=Onchocerca ochengi TaxID=42157 RepID=A0A182DXE1_ONCOC|nr:unnamed protein product [Onchocerca ochengi]
MKNGHSSRYSDMLDEMLGIRSKEENVIQKVALPKQTQLVERPPTRHGRNQETVIADQINNSFSLSFKHDSTNKSDGIVERWQREGEEEEGDDEDEDEEDESNSGSSNVNGTEKWSDDFRQKVETDNKYENDNITIARKITHSPAISIAAETGNRSQHSIDTSNDGQNSDQSIMTIRQRNHSSGVVSNSLKDILEAVEKTNKTERQASQEKLCGMDRVRPIYITPRNKTDSELRKSVEKHSKTITRNESPSPGKAAYEKWFREKLKQEREKRRKQKEKEEEEEKAREERKKEAERNYEIWKQRTDEATRENRRKKKEKAEALTKEKMEEMRRKKEEAAKMFQAWKNDRLQRFSKERKQYKQNKENEELKKKHEMETRNNEAQKAFEAWYEENKTRSLEAQRRLLKSRKTEEMQNRNTKEYKEALAREAYDVWLQIKENERRFNESLQGRIMKFDEMSRRLHSVPWIPPSNIIPRKFVPTHARRHQSVKRAIRSNQTSYKKFPSAVHRSKSAHS